MKFALLFALILASISTTSFAHCDKSSALMQADVEAMQLADIDGKLDAADLHHAEDTLLAGIEKDRAEVDRISAQSASQNSGLMKRTLQNSRRIASEAAGARAKYLDLQDRVKYLAGLRDSMTVVLEDLKSREGL